MGNEVIQTASATSDNDVVINVNDYEDKPSQSCCVKELQICVTVKLKED